MPSKSNSQTEEAAAAPTENLTLCHWGPTKVAPSLSSFVIKLETYLRMTGIPYNVELTQKMSSKGKMPYIRYENKEHCDTNFIIPFLNKTFEKDLNSSLNEVDKAVSRAFLKMAEENTYWTLIHYRYIESTLFSKQVPMTGIRKKLFPFHYNMVIKPGQKSNLQGHGMGRHTKEEVHQIMEEDIRAFSTFLGEKQFFMGDEPTEIDAALFGIFSSFCYMLPDSPHEKLCTETLPNIYAYTQRMREKYWPDWEEMCYHEKKKEEEAAAEANPEKNATKEAEGDAKAEGKKDEKSEEGEEKDDSEQKEDKKDEKENGQKEEEAKSDETKANGDGENPDK